MNHAWNTRGGRISLTAIQDLLHQWEKKAPILLDTKARKFGVPNLAFMDTPVLNTLKDSSRGHILLLRGLTAC